MFRIASIAILCTAILSGCSGNKTCSVTVGTSSMEFLESDLSNSWRINLLTCGDEEATPKELDPNDYIPGSCAQLKDYDYENFYKFQLGLLCYSGGTWDAELSTKGELVLVSDYEHFTR